MSQQKTRRRFLSEAIAATVSTVSAPYVGATGATLRVKSATRRDETILRNPWVNGDNWHLTWASDNRQYSSLCDGYGWFERPPGRYNSRLIAVEGGPHKTEFHDVPDYPELAQPLEKVPRYYNFGVLAVDGRIYQFLSTWNIPYSSDVVGLRFIGVKAIYSPDNGRTWRNQDGSSPVVWQDWRDRSRARGMLFFEEPQDAFSMLSVLQMGRNYADNRDGYVYIYSPNGNVEGTMNELVMLRVPKAQVLNRKAYEYFAGLSSGGYAKWAKSIDGRAAVHTFPRGWVNKTAHPWAWIPSVTYNAALDTYMMANWATAPGPAPELKWFNKPSYLGFWVARNPWGPWTQIHEETRWTPENDAAARCYSPIIAPKWIANDGRSFWLVWTDFQIKLAKEDRAQRKEEIKRLSQSAQVSAEARLDRLARPYYSFNIQRVDLHLG